MQYNCFHLTSREDAARAILNRHITLSVDEEYIEREELLREKLMVPLQWIHHAKVLYFCLDIGVFYLLIYRGSSSSDHFI